MSVQEKIGGVGIVAVATIVLGLASPTVAQQLEDEFVRTLEVTGQVDLEVSTGAGSISVRTGADGSVRVEGRIRARDSSRYTTAELQRRIDAIVGNPPVEQQGNAVRVGDLDEDARCGLRISYELVVPEATSLRSQSGSGSQTIDDLAGPVEAAAGSGSLTIGRIGGRVTAHAGSGSIQVDAARGALEVSTGSGSIRASEVDGGIESSSGSGSVELEQIGAGDVSVRTGSGSIRVRGVDGALEVRTGSGSIVADGGMGGDWRLESSSGGIRVALPDNAAFELDARTSSGRINSRYPITVVGSRSGRQLRGEVGGGGQLLELRTTSGAIRIE